MNDNKRATLELGTKPVGRLLWQYAAPAIVAMVASSLYNIVDSIFIGQGVGALAISGLAITFPFMNLSAAVGACIGVGASTYLSVKLGQKDYSMAQRILGTSLVLKIVTGIIFGALGILFLDPILYFFGATENTISYARDYMLVILLGNVFTHLYFGMNALLRATAKPRQAMYATLFTVALNTVLDPLFIYTFRMGIQGAALATILAQFIAMCWQLWLFSNPKELIHFRRGIYGLDKTIIRNILAIGISPFSMNACACIIVILINTALVRHGGDLAVGAYGIANRIGFLFFMIVMGINQGMQPIAGYNYGARQWDRMLHVLKLGTHSHSSPRHPHQHAGVPHDRLAGRHHQLLPIHREGKNQHLPLALTTDDLPAAPAHHTATHHGCRRCVGGFACLRHSGLHRDLDHHDTLYEEV